MSSIDPNFSIWKWILKDWIDPLPKEEEPMESRPCERCMVVPYQHAQSIVDFSKWCAVQNDRLDLLTHTRTLDDFFVRCWGFEHMRDHAGYVQRCTACRDREYARANGHVYKYPVQPNIEHGQHAFTACDADLEMSKRDPMYGSTRAEALERINAPIDYEAMRRELVGELPKLDDGRGFKLL